MTFSRKTLVFVLNYVFPAQSIHEHRRDNSQTLCRPSHDTLET